MHYDIAVPFANLMTQHEDIANELQDTFQRVLKSGWFIMGKELQQFEKEFAAFIGVKHCIGVGNGLDALVLILRGLNIGPGDEVIVPTHTFIATWLAVSQVGATPVPVETDANYCLDAKVLSAAITQKTKAIFAVHLYGHIADMDAIYEVVGNRQIAVLEDAAQAHGATYKNKQAGSLSGAAGFSFYPGKNLGALGDGGAITTDDTALAERIYSLRNYGSAEKYYHETQGYNSRLDELQAALLRTKLSHLNRWNLRRAEIANLYRGNLSGVNHIALPEVAANVQPVWHQFVICSKQRDALREHLTRCGIQTLIHYPVPNHLQGAYEAEFVGKTYPAYELLTKEILSLPMCPTLQDAQILQVCEAIKSFT